MKFCILLRFYLVNSKKSSTFVAVSSKKAHCVFSEPPKPRWGGDNPPEIISKWKRNSLLMQTASPLTWLRSAHL